MRMAKRLVTAARRRWNLGHCTICDRRTIFVEHGPWLRDEYLCIRCSSIPRNRALIGILEADFPRWRDAVVHESSPDGPASAKLRAEGRRYSSSQFLADAAPGSVVDGVRCEDLERLSFPDSSIDLFVTQDVLEHVLRPELAVREIARVLRPGGAHVFTVPVFKGRQTLVRAEPDDDGGIRLLLPADYHSNPIDPKGSLVVREWGEDFPEFVLAHSGLHTERHQLRDRRRGLDGEFLDVFVTRRPG